MKHTALKIVTPLFAIVLIFSGFTAHAHEGVEHGTAIEAEVHDTLTLTQMETIITLLQKLIVLLKAKNETPYVNVTPVVLITEPTDDVGAPAVEEMEMHHEEHSDSPIDAEPVPVAKLIIEIEAHGGKTHVHARYVDKPEAMFFVDTPMSDEAGVIADIVAKTGLSETEVSEAIVHPGM